MADSLLSEAEISKIERVHVDGMTSAQIVQIFRSRAIKFSEATFRKYVQLGLLPRCRRVGSKGKHRGSHGVYPCGTVRRINDLKQLMAQNYTIEEIQQSLANFKQDIDEVETSIERLLVRFERAIKQPRFDLSTRRTIEKHLNDARRSANALVRHVIQIDNDVSLPMERTSSGNSELNLKS